MSYDIILVGGGLANSLLAYRLRQCQPNLQIVLLEREQTLGGKHTWSFHHSDLTDEQRQWLAPFIEYTWPHHQVRFPRYVRKIASAYSTFTSRRLHDVVYPLLGGQAQLGTEVVEVAPRQVTLADGKILEANAVIDGRGVPRSPYLILAYQKFLGQVVTLERDHGLDGPILMDATVDQSDGYRFLYTLPFTPRQLLIEDTYYSDAPKLDNSGLQAAIAAYAKRQDWRIARVDNEETGVLPIVLGGSITDFWSDGTEGVARSGLSAALFHATTGYSLPDAVRLADVIAQARELSGMTVYQLTRWRSEQLWQRSGFFRLLNRMLFRAAEPAQRYRVLEHFYRLQEPLIQRFYAGQLTWQDQVRLLSGKPPVPVLRAMHCLLG